MSVVTDGPGGMASSIATMQEAAKVLGKHCLVLKLPPAMEGLSTHLMKALAGSFTTGALLHSFVCPAPHRRVSGETRILPT